MEKTATPTRDAQEKIIFETQPMLVPTILNLENLVIIGFVALAAIAAFVFRFGLWEIIIVAALFLLLAVPSFKNIFETGSTHYVLTNRRLVIFKVGLGPREIAIPLEQIQDVRCKSSGLQGLYRAGSVFIKQKGLRSTLRLNGLMDCGKRAEQIRAAMKKLAS